MTRAGFTLLEIVFAIIMISILAIVGVRLIDISVHTAHDAAAAQERMTSLDSAIDALRTDVFNASLIDDVADRRAVLDHRVRWSSDNHGLHRIDHASTRTWPVLSLRFAATPTGLAIRPPKSASDSQADSPMDLISLARWRSAVHPSGSQRGSSTAPATTRPATEAARGAATGATTGVTTGATTGVTTGVTTGAAK